MFGDCQFTCVPDCQSALPRDNAKNLIKGSDDTTPFLGFNEFYTMRVLERLNVVPVAACRMSEDGKILAVDRFDVDGQPQ